MALLDSVQFERARDADLTVITADGEPMPVADLWADTPVVIGFVRHFG